MVGTRRTLAALVLVILAVALPRTSSADRVDDLVTQLATDPDLRARGKAAYRLAKGADRRALPALTKALLQDSEPMIRRVAARALGKLFTTWTLPADQRRIVSALRTASATDADAKVRKNAARVLATLQRKGLITAASAPPVPSPAVNAAPSAATSTTSASDE